METSKDFSVLIPTVYTPLRVESLQRLLKTLLEHLPTWANVIVLPDDGSMSVGEKRNLLRNHPACGTYSAFVDDDDLVTEHYFEYARRVIDAGADTGVMRGYQINNQKEKKSWHFTIDMKTKKTWSNNGPHPYERSWGRQTNHLCVVKTALARQVQFPHQDLGEDNAWSKKFALFMSEREEWTECDPGREACYVYLFNQSTTLTQTAAQIKIYKENLR